MEEIEIIRVDSEGVSKEKDFVTEEVPFTINLNQKEFVTLLVSPSNLKELSAGFIFSSGLITSFVDIENIIIDEQMWAAYVTLKNKQPLSEFYFKRMYTSGCGKRTLIYNALDKTRNRKIISTLRIDRDRIFKFMAAFSKKSEGFKNTGGVHSAALCDRDDIIIFMEDIGRHNAVDKVIGAALLNGISFDKKIFLTSGRISSEIVFKMAKTGVSFIVSRSAPTDQAVKLADEIDLTLIGFARGRKLNVYSGVDRLL